MTDREPRAAHMPGNQDLDETPANRDGAVGVYERPERSGTSNNMTWIGLALIILGVVLIALFVFIL